LGLLVAGIITAAESSCWLNYEKPGLIKNDKATKIRSMRDGTTNPEERPNGDLKARSSAPPTIPTPTKILQLFWDEFVDETSGLSHYWQLYLGEAEARVSPCNEKTIH
jgi:hypothetical protein